MNATTLLIGFACTGLLIGCASTAPPTELVVARQAYAHASASSASQLMPAALLKAREALALAERSFRDDPASSRTRELADLADREARSAEAFAMIASDTAITAERDRVLQSTKTEAVKHR